MFLASKTGITTTKNILGCDSIEINLVFMLEYLKFLVKWKQPQSSNHKISLTQPNPSLFHFMFKGCLEYTKEIGVQVVGVR